MPVHANNPPLAPPVPLALSDVKPTLIPGDSFYRLSVDQYHQMAQAGVLCVGDRVELLEGMLIQKMTISPLHAFVTDTLADSLRRLLSDGWLLRVQQPITLPNGEPEPDLVMARGKRADYLSQHPSPASIALVVEVADTCLGQDRGQKKRIYAQAGIPNYWIINLVEKTVEVYSESTGTDFIRTQVFKVGEKLPVQIGGPSCGEIDIKALFG